jgi:hypothetical protein
VCSSLRSVQSRRHNHDRVSRHVARSLAPFAFSWECSLHSAPRRCLISQSDQLSPARQLHNGNNALHSILSMISFATQRIFAQHQIIIRIREPARDSLARPDDRFLQITCPSGLLFAPAIPWHSLPVPIDWPKLQTLTCMYVRVANPQPALCLLCCRIRCWWFALFIVPSAFDSTPHRARSMALMLPCAFVCLDCVAPPQATWTSRLDSFAI